MTKSNSDCVRDDGKGIDPAVLSRQDSVFLGVKHALGRSWSFDLGYMLVYQQKPSGYQYDLDHTLRWIFYFTPDLRKAKSLAPPGEWRGVGGRCARIACSTGASRQPISPK